MRCEHWQQYPVTVQPTGAKMDVRLAAERPDRGGAELLHPFLMTSGGLRRVRLALLGRCRHG